MPRTPYPAWLSTAVALLAAGAGVVHVVFLVVKAEGPADSFLVMLLLASALPYALCVFIARPTRQLGAALGGLALIVALDVWMFWSVFVEPKGSTAALGLLFAPVWKLFVALPLGGLLGFAVDAAITKRSFT